MHSGKGFSFSFIKANSEHLYLSQWSKHLGGLKAKVPCVGDMAHLAALNFCLENNTYAAGRPAKSCTHIELSPAKMKEINFLLAECFPLSPIHFFSFFLVIFLMKAI